MKKIFKDILEMTKKYIITERRRLWLCFDTGILLMGVFLCWFDAYIKSLGGETNSSRTFWGGMSITLWFWLFPSLKIDEKEKIMRKVLFHFWFSIGMLFLLVLELEYLLKNISGGSILGEFLFCIVGIIIFTYLCYILSDFVKTFLYLLEKLRNYVFSKAKERVSGFVKVLEAITAIIVSITALGTSIIGMVTLIDQIK